MAVDWDRLVARVITATSWSFDQAEALTLPRLLVLLRYWGDAPPMNELVAYAHALILGSSGLRTGSKEKPTDTPKEAGVDQLIENFS